MVELRGGFSVPFCVAFEGRQIDCLFIAKKLFISSADLKRESGKDFPFVTVPVLGMDETIMKFTALATIKKGEISDSLLNLLSSLRPEEGENALKEAFNF